uniref:Uncharacterized protein n=1 Tax=Romanomermis culicivorax TaxID=13658 RepID=A0A915IBN9_ROMCU
TARFLVGRLQADCNNWRLNASYNPVFLITAGITGFRKVDKTIGILVSRLKPDYRNRRFK